MNYAAIYKSLVERAKTRTLTEYTETHHVLPKCMGGDDDRDNLVNLTPEEHYVAHQLLSKMYPENGALAKAAQMMTCNRPSNKLYGWVRKRHATAMRESQLGQNNNQYGSFWIHNPETRESRKVFSDTDIPEGWVRGRKIKKITEKEKWVQSNKEKREKSIDFLREVMYYYKDNEISMRDLSKKFKVGHNVYVSFERYFKDEYREIVKNKKGNSNVAKGRY